MTEKELAKVNTAALAYMGDAVWEQYVREHILERGSYDVNKLNATATTFARASAQEKIIRSLFDSETEKEKDLVKRERNRKYNTRA